MFVSQRFTDLLSVLLMAAALLLGLVSAGGKGKGGEEDIIMYNGNIVIRGDKSGGSIIMGGTQPSNEEVEFSPSFFNDGQFGEMGGFGRRR